MSIIMTPKLNVLDKTRVYQEKNDLIFEIKIINNTAKTIEISKSIRPFSLLYQGVGVHRHDSNIRKKKIPVYIKIPPHKHHIYKFKLNIMYKLFNGFNEYTISYLSHFYEIGLSSSANIEIDHLWKNIKFKWYQVEGSNQGYLVNDKDIHDTWIDVGKFCVPKITK